MIQGTASSSGKSLITAALCRIFHQDGCRVAPFKAQNMSNNSFVTADGLEMGRAQVVQAYAAGLEPDVRMNPVLLKPSSDTGAQVVLKGKSVFTMNARDWHATRNVLRDTIRRCYESLAAGYELIVIEGAGSPAEINLKKNDIVNMGMAKMADAPVLIVGDIDRGGVFASLVGTMQLLDPDERDRVKGFIINKFRGEAALLQPGLDELERITGVPVLGVVPWMEHAIDDEDAVTERFARKKHSAADVDICIIRLPHISNFTDFLPLEAVDGVRVRWCAAQEEIGAPDLLILPGTKATISDLQTIRTAGITDAVTRYVHNGGTVLGICGGFQMLGAAITDPDRVESLQCTGHGLGLLDMHTVFAADKITGQTAAVIDGRASWLFAGLDDNNVRGYEIHSGVSIYGKSIVPFTRAADGSVTGAANESGRVMGTYLHGLFDTGKVVSGMINALRAKKGLPALAAGIADRQKSLIDDLDHCAAVCRQCLDLAQIRQIINLHRHQQVTEVI
jgi:adenosylcobyric acid synthase